MVAQRVNGIVVQVEFSQSGTGREGAIREGPQTVRPQSENTEAGQDWRNAGGHLWNLDTHNVMTPFKSNQMLNETCIM